MNEERKSYCLPEYLDEVMRFFVMHATIEIMGDFPVKAELGHLEEDTTTTSFFGRSQ